MFQARVSLDIFLKNVSALDCVVRYSGKITLRKLECFKQTHEYRFESFRTTLSEGGSGGDMS